MPGDRLSECWDAQRYYVDLDPDAHLSLAGLTVKGLAVKIRSIKRWRIERSEDRLNVWVDNERTIIKPTFLQSHSESQTMGPAMQILNDIVEAVEALNAIEVYPFFVPTGGNWEIHDYVIGGTIREDATRRFINPARKYRFLAAALTCLMQNGTLRFDEVRLVDTVCRSNRHIPTEYILITNHCSLLQPGEVLFQP